MTISIGDYSFNESRIDRILNSDSLDEAQSMGLLDRVIDFFRGGVKRAAIETVFKQITTADNDHGGNLESRQLARFEALREMVKPEHAGKFAVDVSVDRQADTWNYSFSIDGTKMHGRSDIPLGLGHDFIAFQDASILGRTAQVLSDAGHADAMHVIDDVREKFSEMNAAAFEIKAFDADAANKFAVMEHSLRDLKLQMSIDIEKRDSYVLCLNEKPVHQGALLPVDQDTGKEFVDIVLAGVKIAKNTAYNQFKDTLNAIDDFISGNVQCMVDGENEQKALFEALNDPAYGKSAFTGIKDSGDPATFIAVFGDKELVFSDRASTRNEFRSDLLKAALQDSDYGCLRDLASQGHLTETDPSMIYVFSPSRQVSFEQHKNLHMSEDETKMLDKEVAGLEVGKTTLGALWGIEVPQADEKSGLPQGGFDGNLTGLYV